MQDNSHAPAWQQGAGEMPFARLASGTETLAEIYRYGAHLTRWRSGSGRDWIFTSREARFAPGKAIRGGVPLIFPQFNAFGQGPRHGFARTRDWEPVSLTAERIELGLHSDADSRSAWPHDFSARYSVELAGSHALIMALAITNTGQSTCSFTAALHTYIKVDALAQTTLEGLQGLSYWDNDGTPFGHRQRETAATLAFSDAIDRVYFGTEQPLYLRTGAGTLMLEQSGFGESVVWNPGRQAATAMSDLADDEFDSMLCVEAARIDKPVVLEPGQHWIGQQTLTDQSG